MIKQTKDYEMIKKMLIEDKELFERISDDYTDISKYDPSKSEWLGWFDGDECKALLSIHEENAVVLNIHIHIPAKNRGKDSFAMGNGLLRHLEKTCLKRFVKINAKIPQIYPDVIKYAEKNGFEIEGIDKMSYIKKGKLYNRVILGKLIVRSYE